MPAFAALLRAINVGKTGKLAMTDLSRWCEGVGFTDVRTYIQSGNVVFKSSLSEAKVKAKLEKALAVKMQKPSCVLIRTSVELAAVARRNPFKDAAPNRLLILFLDEKPAPNSLSGLKIPGREEVRLVGREVFIHFPDGMGRSKLKLPFSQTATGRNLNTVMKLAAMTQSLEARPGTPPRRPITISPHAAPRKP